MTPFGQLDTEEKIALHRAFYNGQPIEFTQGRDQWGDMPNGLFFPEGIYRIKVVPPKDIEVPWSAFLPIIQWAARDGNGGVYIYKTQPRRDEINGLWVPPDGFYVRINPNYFVFSPGDKPWDESLIKRPEGV